MGLLAICLQKLILSHNITTLHFLVSKKVQHYKLIFISFLSCSFLLPIGNIFAEMEQQKPAPSENSEEEAEETQVGSVSEYVFVEGSLPFVPTSNTIVNKLPLKLKQLLEIVYYIFQKQFILTMR